MARMHALRAMFLATRMGMDRMSFGKLMRLVAAAIVLALACGLAQADSWDSVPPKKTTILKLYMQPKQVLERMSGSEAGKTLFVDVRTPQEVMFVGMPQLADANAPYMVLPELSEWDGARKAFKLVQNSGFVGDIKSRLAAKDLGKDGRRMLGGWKNEGLPWSFELSREKMSSL